MRRLATIFPAGDEPRAAPESRQLTQKDNNAGWCDNEKRLPPCQSWKAALPSPLRYSHAIPDRRSAELGSSARIAHLPGAARGKDFHLHRPRSRRPGGNPYLEQHLANKVRISIFIAHDPGVQVADSVRPWTVRNAASSKIVMLLDCPVELTDRPRQPAGRKSGEIVAKQIGTECFFR